MLSSCHAYPSKTYDFGDLCLMFTIVSRFIHWGRLSPAFLIATTIGVVIVFFLHRRIPNFLVEIYNFGALRNLVPFWILFAVLVVLALKRFPRPEGLGVFSIIGALWAISSTMLLGGAGPFGGPFLVLMTAILATFLSFFTPARGGELLLFLPSLLYLLVIFGRTIFGGPSPVGTFGLGESTGSISYGHLMVVGFLLTYFFSQRFANYRNLIFSAGSVFIVGVMLSASRGALVGLIVAVVLLVVGVLKMDGTVLALREVKRFTLLGIVTAAPFFLTGVFLPNRDTQFASLRRVAQTFELSEQVGSVQIPVYSAGRFQLWATTLEQFETFTDVLIGKGKSTIQMSSEEAYPHNLFLELFLIGGLVTILPFVLFLYFLFQKMFAPVYAGRFDFFVLAATTGVFSMFSGDLSYNVVFFFSLGLVYGQILRNTEQTIILRN